MGVRLEVRTQERKWVDSPEGFRSTDEKKADLIHFCSRHNIPYPRLDEYDFVSVWAMPANWKQTKQLGDGRSMWISRNADSYGKEIILLGDHVVDSLAYVACGDFQNVIMEAAELERTGKDVRSYLHKSIFIFTPTLSRADRIARLEDASAEARRRSKLGDAEARLLRRLSNSDRQRTSDAAVE
jgi:hypothetical protein